MSTLPALYEIAQQFHELALLAVHGVLHLFGMDHEQDEDATQMEAMERDLLARFYEVDR